MDFNSFVDTNLQKYCCILVRKEVLETKFQHNLFQSSIVELLLFHFMRIIETVSFSLVLLSSTEEVLSQREKKTLYD